MCLNVLIILYFDYYLVFKSSNDENLFISVENVSNISRFYELTKSHFNICIDSMQDLSHMTENNNVYFSFKIHILHYVPFKVDITSEGIIVTFLIANNAIFKLTKNEKSPK